MSGQVKRQRRSKVACEPCRTRKRKCNGQHPCEMCTDSEYTCHYDLGSRKKRNKGLALGNLIAVRPAHTQQAESPSQFPTTPTPRRPLPLGERFNNSVQQSIGPNSGAVFVQNLGLKIDPVNALDPQVFAWNIGLRQLPGSFTAMPIVNIISAEEMTALTHIYFDKVAPYYGFVGKDSCFEYISSRWDRPSAFEPSDVVLCGVAAMGYLFSRRKAVAAELHLIESAKSALEQRSGGEIPPLMLITGWALRVSYLRLTASPHTAWLASSSLMHLIDATGLHLDPSSRHALLRPTLNIDDDIRRRLVSFAQYINTWVSFDLARSRIVLHGASYTTPTSPDGDYTAEMLDLLPLSESLDPFTRVDAVQLTAMLANIMQGSRAQPPSVLSQCNLVLCIFRRLRAVHSTLSPALMSQMLALITKALACARQLVDANCPWSHVAYVPFQIICTLLVVDSPESLSLLDDAVQTLKYVTDVYGTEVLRDAYRTAGSLILLQQRRKDHDSARLNSILGVHFAPDHENSSQRRPSMQDFESFRELVADLSSSENFDFAQFFIADNPWNVLGMDS
ncbi:protein RDR1 [Aspergillus lentulus]|uniref:Protein RDR1 n=1 Tax=Aspergillus lentulus TaxID=293939 RepID=A0ABQ1AG08_ASPLE|nr:protein RDR1 [Aspergillus lentulus]